jgi:hypothetical protein
VSLRREVSHGGCDEDIVAVWGKNGYLDAPKRVVMLLGRRDRGIGILISGSTEHRFLRWWGGDGEEMRSLRVFRSRFRVRCPKGHGERTGQLAVRSSYERVLRRNIL